VIAPARLPPEFKAWNRAWHAPTGRAFKLRGPLRRTQLAARYRGPFGFQPNNTTRIFEYPWAYHQVCQVGASLDIVEIGGALSGLQFVLGHSGHRVTNVDPGEKSNSLGWPVDQKTHQFLSKTFRANARLLPCTLDEANIEDGSADVVLCLSVIEHLSAHDLDAVLSNIRRILRPNGYLVMTVDLFLDLHPFTNRTSNRWGSNVKVSTLLESAGLALVAGRRDELLGFEDFSAQRVMENLGNYLIGGYPALAQCFTARPAGRNIGKN
jgi:SAM-dependent methyltransferase